MVSDKFNSNAHSQGLLLQVFEKRNLLFLYKHIETKELKMAKTVQEYETVIKYLKMTVELQEHIIELQKEIIILGKAAEFPNCKITYTGFNPGV